MRHAQTYTVPVVGPLLDGWKPHLTPPADQVDCDDLCWAVLYRQGFRVEVVALFTDSDDALLAADAMNARDGFTSFQVAKLVAGNSGASA